MNYFYIFQCQEIPPKCKEIMKNQNILVNGEITIEKCYRAT